jgi:hypothetical protein
MQQSIQWLDCRINDPEFESQLKQVISLYQKDETDFGAQAASYLIGIWIISRRLKRQGLEAYNLHVSIA